MNGASGVSENGIRRRLRRPSLCLILPAIALLGGSTAGAAAQRPAGPSLDAAAWVLVDARDGSRVAGAAAGERRPIASATKLMTAYLVLRELDLDRKLRAANYDPAPAESVLGLEAGERIGVRDLLVALLLPSANDAAVTLAEGVSGSVRRFVSRMNRAARRLGLDDTSYANPIGLDDRDNYSSARDLAELALVLRSDRRFRRIVSKREATLKSGARRRVVETRNTLLGADPSVDGVKTGHTLGAGYVLVGSAERKGVPLISVVLGAPSEAARDGETAKLLDYGFKRYRPKLLLAKGDVVTEVEVSHEDAALPLIAGRSVRARLRPDQDPEPSIEAPTRLEGPIPDGERLGRAGFSLGGERIAGTPLLAARAVPAPSVIEEVSSGSRTALIVVGSILGLAAILAVVRRRGSDRGERTAEERMMSQRARTRDRQRRDPGR